MFVRISCILPKLSIQITVFLVQATGFRQLNNLQCTLVPTLLLLCEDGGMCAVPSFKADFRTLNCFSRRNGFYEVK